VQRGMQNGRLVYSSGREGGRWRRIQRTAVTAGRTAGSGRNAETVMAGRWFRVAGGRQNADQAGNGSRKRRCAAPKRSIRYYRNGRWQEW